MIGKYKIGLVGYGTIGKVHHQAINHSGNKFVLSVICDSQKPRNVADIKFHNNYQDLLRDKNIDVISIATPPSSHYKIALDSLNSKKHVLVEKPPSLTSKQCKSLSNLAKVNKAVLFTAFHMRYNPAVIFATKKMSQLQIKTIKIIFKEYVLNFHHPNGWVFNPKISGGGVLMDSGINALSVVNSILQYKLIYKVKKVRLVKDKEKGIEVKAKVDFEFNKQGEGSLLMDWLDKTKDIRLISFQVKNDSYSVNINAGSFERNGKTLFKISRGTNTMLEEYKGSYQHFFDCIESNKSFVSTTELEFIEDIYRFTP